MYQTAKAVDNGNGILFIYGNYAGDNLNFDMGEEFLNADGIKTAHVRGMDDVVSQPPERKDERRGIAGALYMVKIAGAVCDAGLSLEEAKAVMEKTRDSIRSVGVATSGAQLPGADKPIFELPEGMIEYGMGVHGERGVKRVPMEPADTLVDNMMQSIFDDGDYKEGDEVCVYINAFGSTSITEMAIAYRRVRQILAEKGIKVYDSDINNYFRTQEMGGFSITLFTLDDELPEMPAFEEGIRRAPSRGFRLSEAQTETALKNALRYIPPKYHKQLIPEFLNELYTRGRIYGYRFRPEGEMPLGYLPTPITDTLRGWRNLLKFNPYVDFIFNGLQFHTGMVLAWDAFTEGQSTTFRFFPDVVVSKKLMKEAVAVSMGFTGGIDANDWNGLRLVNPYISPNAEQRTTRHYDLSGHLRWSLSKKLEANAEACFSWMRDDLTFRQDANYQLRNVYIPYYVDDNRFTLGADLAFVNDEMLTLRAGGHYYKYGSVSTVDEVMPYRPKWDALLSADVNYNNKWLFHLEGRLLGKMEGDGEELPMRYGINAEVEYRHNKALSFFLTLDNLAFQRYYYWANYPSQKGLFMIGLTYTLN